MLEDRPQNRNIETTIVNGKYVSTAEIWRFFGSWLSSFETFVWEYDYLTGHRGKLLYETYQRTKKEALKVHRHMVKNFLKEE